MKELENVIRTESANSCAGTCDSFNEAAKLWAAFSLEHFRDGLLKEALNISAAMVQFTHEMEKPK